MRKLKGQKGLSLIEVTIMLLVLMLLTSVLAPSIMDFVKDAQWVKVKEDCEAIALSIARLTRDVGPCLQDSTGGYGGPAGCTIANRADILVSDGRQALAGPGTASLFTNGNSANVQWWSGIDPAVDPNVDTLENQLVVNGPNYPHPPSYPTVGPLFGLGYRGAYVSPPIGPDPWGQAYEVNTAFLYPAIDAPNPGEGQAGWENDVICISAGPDGTIQTNFGEPGVHRLGDDWVTVIQGATR